MKDILVFVVLPLSAVIFYKLAEGAVLSSERDDSPEETLSLPKTAETKSQILIFSKIGQGGSVSSAAKRSPGTLVKLRLFNRVESLDGASAHAQVIDGGLGSKFVGATMIGDVVSDASTGRISLNFRFVKDLKSSGTVFPIVARAMSLDGVAGLEAKKKEGFFARSALRSGASSTASVGSDSSSLDFRSLVAKTIATGMMQEFQDEAGVANKRAQVLTLEPGTEFFAELTDFFPASH